MIGLGGQEILLLGLVCGLPMIAGVVILVVVLVCQSKKKNRDHEEDE